jgi:rhamnogalacturonan acetylesterase
MKLSKIITVFIFIVCVFINVNSQVKDDVRPIVADKQIVPAKTPNPKLPTLFIVGDSTVKSDVPLRGWGQDLDLFFNADKINVVNRAVGGRSSRSFQYEGRWDKVLSELKKGDFVVIQFGHNDVGKYDDKAAKDRPALHGEGDETADVTRLDGKSETVHSFGWYLRKYGNDAKAKGATVIFCSMVPHKDWENGKIIRKESETFVKWTENAAKITGAYFVNLNEMIALEFEKIGQEKVESFFADKRTHSTPAGSMLNAENVVKGLLGIKKLKIEKYLTDKGKLLKKK